MHVFSPDFSRECFENAGNPLIVGGGISAAQLAIHKARLVESLSSTQRPVITVVSPHPVTVTEFDSDPCYIGPRCMEEFASMKDIGKRRTTIDRVRYPGTIPSDVEHALRSAVEQGRVRWIVGNIDSIETENAKNGDSMTAVIHTGGDEIRESSDLIVPATGFENRSLFSTILGRIATDYGLSRDATGTPVTDRCLRWHSKLLLAGRHAELTLGPAAPNIIGAHLAARRLVRFFASEPECSPTVAGWKPLSGAKNVN